MKSITITYTNGDVTVTSYRIYDVTDRNPYETKTVFAATLNEAITKTSIFFLCNSCKDSVI